MTSYAEPPFPGRSVAVIPARGGSKRIPRKNIRPFLGVPLLARTLNLLAGSDLFEALIVSTDDEEIADVARRAGASVPFQRPAELADDLAPTLPVIAHAIEQLGSSSPDFVCCVYPAAVLTMVDDLSQGLRLLRESSADYVFTATSFPYPIYRALRRVSGGDGCEMLWPEYRDTRSQDLPETFHDAGQFYWGRREAWLAQRPIYSPKSRMLLLPRHRVQDIDTEEDWVRAEQLVRLQELDTPRSSPA